MAAPRVVSLSSRRLFFRYRKFFLAAAVTLGLQLFLCHYFLNISLRAGDSEICNKDGSGKVPFSKDGKKPLAIREEAQASDKSISANGGKGPPPPGGAPDGAGRRHLGQSLQADDSPADQIHVAGPEEDGTASPNAAKAPEVERPPTGQPATFKPQCDVSAKDVASAIRRSKTRQCQQEIADVWCLQQAGKLYSLKLPNFCPNRGNDAGKYYGCYRDSMSHRELEAGMEELANNTPQACIDHCFRSGMKYAGLQFTKECWCGSQFGQHSPRLEEAHCHSKCPGNSSETCGAYLSNKIYGTGVQEVKRVETPLEHRALNASEPRVKIVFVLTVNGRAIRQVVRLLRVIYSPDHFYYIHVDKRQEFLYRELLPLQERFPNVMLTSVRFSTIWGGASLLQAHLSFLRELFVEKPKWDWDYYINLSESDYPVKTISELVEYLTAYKGINFLRSFGKNVPRFIKKQGMDQTFFECENHLWRVGPRPLPAGIVFDGGSDWIGLWREFAHYALFSDDELVEGLKQYYKYSLLPVESYFHMVLQNSQFCGQSTDNNLHLTNWRRKQGCRCQYKHIVDWCGCSPNDLKISDIEKLISFEKKPMFFARKFEAIVDQAVINMLDKTMHGYLYAGMPALSSYWQNVYHHLDKSTKVSDAALTLYTSATRRALKYLAQVAPTCFEGTSLKPTDLLEASVYNEDDHFHGIATLFNAEVKATGKVMTFEVLMGPKYYYTVVNAKAAKERLLGLEVGTEFDMKELMFRNYGSLMGPFAEISLRHEWGPGAELTASLAWVDPTNVIAASYDVHIPTSRHVGHQKPQLQTPLRPGVWAACVMVDLVLVARVQFLVTPLTVFNAAPILPARAAQTHSGPRGSELYTSTDFSEFMPNLGLKDSPELREESRANSQLTGEQLDRWVDDLADLFWPVQHLCSLAGGATSSPGCAALPHCQSSGWSSRSPDPKSDLRYVGEKIPVHLPPDR